MSSRNGALPALALIAAFAAAGPAQANTGDTVFSCEFQGLTGTLEPSLPPIPSSITPTSPLNGKYHFNGRADCFYRDGPTGILVLPVPELNGNATITSDGDFWSYTCGAGWAGDADGGDTRMDIDDNAPTVFGSAASIPLISGVGYELAFAAGAGALHIGGESVNPHTVIGQPLGGSWRGSGVLDIFPEGATLDNNNCLTDEVVESSVTGVFSGVGF